MSPLRANRTDNAKGVGRTHAWIALFAMSWALLAPAVSRALAEHMAEASAWAEVCSATASAQAGKSGQDQDGTARLHRALNHCPLCTLGLEHLALPAAVFAWVGPASQQAAVAHPSMHVRLVALMSLPPVRGPPCLQTPRSLV